MPRRQRYFEVPPAQLGDGREAARGEHAFPLRGEEGENDFRGGGELGVKPLEFGDIGVAAGEQRIKRAVETKPEEAAAEQYAAKHRRGKQAMPPRQAEIRDRAGHGIGLV